MKKLINTLMLVCFLLVCQHNVQAQSVALGEQSETVSSIESSLYQNPKTKGKATYTDDLLGSKKEASSSLENKSKKQKKQKKQASQTTILTEEVAEPELVVIEEVEEPEVVVVKEVAEPEVVVVEEVAEPEVVVVEEVAEPEVVVVEKPAEPEVGVVEEPAEPEGVVVEEVAEPEVVVVKEEKEEDLQPVESSLAKIPRNYTKFIATEVVGKDSRLAWISYKYYGVKDFWVYIYEANLDQVSSPNYVKPGQKLRIPALDSKYTDLNDPEVQKLLLYLSQEYTKH